MYQITDDGKFVIENYNWQTSFSNFFPGIAGKYGIPMWVYYVSRNQGVISAGIRDKSHPIMEFRSYNKALAVVSSQGFRTFLKVNGDYWEPFRKVTNRAIKQTMTVSPAELELEESNRKSGITTSVLYYMLVNTPYPGLVRTVTLTNTSKEILKISFIDGLPRILPYGVGLHGVTTIARHIEGMMEVVQQGGAPLFRLKQAPADNEKVGRIEGGNFYLNSDAKRATYIVDPFVVFGENEIYDQPWSFIQEKSLKALLQQKQTRVNRTPCAFTAGSHTLRPGGSYTFHTVVGYAKSSPTFNAVRKDIAQPKYFSIKRRENRELIDSIKNNAFTASGDTAFDRFCEQQFLDNVIRGGMPELFQTAAGESAFYLYSRQNGDLERDYHHFVIEPTYYSQGTGHYRSINQNRRCDTWFFPHITDRNIVTFMNLIQLDAYNPLEVTQLSYSLVKPREATAWLRKLTGSKSAQQELFAFLSAPAFTPGEFIMKLEELGVRPKQDYDTVLRELLAFAGENECGAVHEGFWVDHWFYNLDLIDTYLMLYPDRIRQLLLDNRDYYFFDDPDVIQPREKNFVLVNDYVHQYNVVTRDPDKLNLIAARTTQPHRARIRHGQGAVYYTNLLVKLLCLVTNRMATLDPAGIGVEMEADKPGWNDSMNGLPGIIGSSLCETLELERALRFLAESCDALSGGSVRLYNELYEFMTKLEKAVLTRLRAKKKNRAFLYWDESHTLKELYREKVKFGVEGKETTVTIAKIAKFIAACQELIATIHLPENRKKVSNKDGVPYTYFINEVTKYKPLRDKKNTPKLHRSGRPLVMPQAFKHTPLPLFLEGPVHLLRVHPELRDRIYRGVRGSAIYDKKLKMYKVCEPLARAPFEVGRVKAWGPGWIENESVYTHMLYKYLLELLKSGLHDEFFSDIQTMLAPYFEPAVYGRSPFENVSFIVSSAFPDKHYHGRGLQPRLSGVTGEMVNIWILMVAGPQPFFMEGSELRFRLRPALHARFFAAKKHTVQEGKRDFVLPQSSFYFRLFGNIDVMYKNSKRKNTYGKGGVYVTHYQLYYRDSNMVTLKGSVIKAPYSHHIRDGEIKMIVATLG